MSTALEIATTAATAADNKKAQDIVVLDISRSSDVSDYFVVVTSASNPQTNAILDEIEERVRLGLKEKPLSVEGKKGLSWVLMDYGPVVVHVMQPEARAFYRLERLWGDGERVILGLEGEAPEDLLTGAGELTVEEITLEED